LATVDDEAPGHPARVVTDGDAIQQADLAARALWAAGARPGQPLPIGASGLNLMTRPEIVAGASRIKADLAGADLERYAPDIPWPSGTPWGYLCYEGELFHWNDDHFLIEIVDLDTGQPAPTGGTGAVVVTDLAREGSPLVRYWTGQGADVWDTPCRCGRTLATSRSLGAVT